MRNSESSNAAFLSYYTLLSPSEPDRKMNARSGTFVKKAATGCDRSRNRYMKFFSRVPDLGIKGET